MLTIKDFMEGSATGKARGNWQFTARDEGGQWQILYKGRKLWHMRWWSTAEAGLCIYSPFTPGPTVPRISPALLAHARAQLAGAKA